MLVNGWSTYLWNTVPRHSDELPFAQKTGLDLSGTAYGKLTKKPLKNGVITMVVTKNGESAFLSQETDNTGNFTFPGLLFNDTASIYIQARNEKGKTNTEIKLHPFFNPEVSKETLNSLETSHYFPKELMKLEYRNLFNERKYKSPQRRKRSSEGTKTNENIKNGTHFKLYESADFVLEIDENEASHENILDYMEGKVPEVDINADNVRIRGTGSFGSNTSPLFWVDGIPLISNDLNNLSGGIISGDNIPGDEDTDSEQYAATNQIIQSVKAIPINDVERIEILKSPQNLAVFGLNGGNGVIAIYLRKERSDTSNQLGKGVMEKRITGFASVKQFYSPKYTPENTNISIPDYRTILYWNPNVIIQNEKKELRFFTSDEKGNYRIIIEGIMNNGRICLGEGEFEVIKE